MLTVTGSADALSDFELAARMAAGEQVALDVLYQRYGGMIYGLALRISGSSATAEEITQDTFLKAWHRAAQWDAARGTLPVWLASIARYTAIDHLRRERRRLNQHASSLDDMLEWNNGLPASAVVDNWQSERMLRALMEQLPREQAQAVQLAFFGGMTHSEIAESLSLPLGTVKTRVRLGLQKLKALWMNDARLN